MAGAGALRAPAQRVESLLPAHGRIRRARSCGPHASPAASGLCGCLASAPATAAAAAQSRCLTSGRLRLVLASPGSGRLLRL